MERRSGWRGAVARWRDGGDEDEGVMGSSHTRIEWFSAPISNDVRQQRDKWAIIVAVADSPTGTVTS